MNLYTIIRPILFALDAELAHTISLKALKFANCLGLTKLFFPATKKDAVSLMGLSFPNRIGLAAGMDKNADYLDALGDLGFGFIEVGTVTPRAQPGNPRPRLFRLPKHQAIINRMGFNNKGVEHLISKVRKSFYNGVVGINIGKNFDTPNEQAAKDYLLCLERAYIVADYIAINVSSPNTKGLRDLQDLEPLRVLLSLLIIKRNQLHEDIGRKVPLLLKIAPDMDSQQLEQIAELVKELKLDGIIATNTTIERSAVSDSALANEAGGLSGAPLTEKSLQVVSVLRKYLGPELALIGVGGVMSSRDAKQMLEAGADLVQIYSGLVYQGPNLIRDCISCS